MSTISKPVMVHQESNFIYRPAVKSEVLVSPGVLPGASPEEQTGLVSLGFCWSESEVGHKLTSGAISYPPHWPRNESTWL